MNTRERLGLILVLMTAPALALAQDHGSGGSGGSGHEGGSSGCGDVFGELVHILRDPSTGQPILQKRWIEEKGKYDWGYCPIPINGTGEEIGFAPVSCDALDADAVVEVDYFGRLSGGRTKERNGRMHFDEVISSIKDPAVGRVSEDETGRIALGYDCQEDRCATWRVIDSPMENMALYTRIMKYGHLQTDPMEVDVFAHGDPAAGTQYHPALTGADYAKFDGRLQHLLPTGGADSCWYEGGGFVGACAGGEYLQPKDFVRAASSLAGAASKTGIITADLVQYMNRILKITLDTPLSTASVATLPALIRDCGEEANAAAFPAEAGPCTIQDATPSMRAPANELFVDFSRVTYTRASWRNMSLDLLQRADASTWKEVDGVKLLRWLTFVNGKQTGATAGIDGFALATSDGLRSIEFVHNYAVPEDLWPALVK